jgi:hypothetical protein
MATVPLGSLGAILLADSSLGRAFQLDENNPRGCVLVATVRALEMESTQQGE